ncbi:hypothetical protein A9Q81_04645 [Gammaproteobacteria bacterium 42_54_T18]|nr:hypothetical protein A9Q81_04645 [Gammaproteobacteria bacterium 42_54_T18]
MDGLGYTREDIEEGFGQNIGPMTSSALMHSRYWFLSIAIGFVPLIGMAVIGALITWLVTSNTYAVTQFVQGGRSLDVYLYFGCSLFGVGVLAGLVQRVLLTTKSNHRYVTLRRDEQPELYAFVEKISLLVGVAAPSVIRLDAQVGLLLKSKELALFQKRSGRTELIIGLPLLYSLSVRQLAGVISHAFSGHDARASVNGYPFIASVNSWLYRVSTQQQVVAYNSSALLKVVWFVQWPFDRIAQQFFHVLYRLSSAISFNVSRQMDMAADLTSAQVTGSTEFRTTQFKLRALFYGQKSANEALADGFQRGELSPNYAEHVVRLANSLRLELRPTLIREMEDLVTPMSRSRVVDLGRIVNVERKQFDASCFLLGNATRLLNGLDQISQDVSIKHYQWLGIKEPGAFLHQNSIQEEREQSAAKTLAQTFCGWESSGRYIRIEGVNSYSELSSESRVQDLQNLIVKISGVQDQIGLLSLRYVNLSERSQQLHVDKTLTAVKLHLKEKGERANLSRLKEQELSWLRTLNEEGALKGDLSYFETLLSQRISIALSLALQSDVLSKQLGIDDMLMHVELLQDAFTFMHRIQESVKRLSSYAQILGKLLEWQCRVGEPLDMYIERYYHYCVVELGMISESLGAVSYPLINKNKLGGSRTDEFESIADVMEQQIVGFQQNHSDVSVSQVFRVSHSSLAFIENLHCELLSEVTRIALAVEEYFDME